MGAVLPEDKLKELKYPILCLDNDKTGIFNTLKLIKKYNNIKTLILPDEYIYKDLNELKSKNLNLDIEHLIKNNIYEGIYSIILLQNKL